MLSERGGGGDTFVCRKLPVDGENILSDCEEVNRESLIGESESGIYQGWCMLLSVYKESGYYQESFLIILQN